MPEKEKNPRIRFHPFINSRACVQCLACVAVCPHAADIFEVVNETPVVVDASFCEGCLHCERICRVEAVSVSEN